MFDNIKTFIKGLINKMFNRDELKKIIGQDIELSATMIDKIKDWSSMLAGKAEWTNDMVHSLRIEQGVCKELANICLNEMTAKISDDKLDELFKQSIRELNENLQQGLGLGSFIMRPLGNGGTEYITPDRFVPIAFDNSGRLVNVAFIDTKKVKHGTTTVYYRRFEYHQLTDKGLIIHNDAYISQSKDDIGTPCPLEEVEAWSKLPKEPLLYSVNRVDFGYYRNPIPNTIDGSNCGVSVFDNSADIICKADIQFGRLDWEFESGERAVQVDVTALKDIEGKKKLPNLNNRLYKGIDQPDLFNVFSPEFRDTNLINGLNAYLRRIEFNCSLAYGDLSDVSEVSKTATEIKTAKQRKFNMVTAIQANIKECLDDYIFALAFYNSMATRKYEFICDFKDSILTDDEAERKQDMADVAAGLMNPWEYRVKWYAEDEETAKANVPQVAQVME